MFMFGEKQLFDILCVRSTFILSQTTRGNKNTRTKLAYKKTQKQMALLTAHLMHCEYKISAVNILRHGCE